MGWLSDSRPVILALVVQGLHIGGRHWFGLIKVAPFTYLAVTFISIFLVISLTIVYMILACKRVLFYDYKPLRPILFGLLVLTVPEGLIRAGFCFHSFRYATNEDLIRYAVDNDIRKGQVDPTIATVEQFYERYGSERCCFVADDKYYFRKDSMPWYVRIVDVFFSGPTAEVVLNYDSKVRHIEVNPCGDINRETYTIRNSGMTAQFGGAC